MCIFKNIFYINGFIKYNVNEHKNNNNKNIHHCNKNNCRRNKFYFQRNTDKYLS